ncbi:NAD P-binding protein [Gloeophyllum trabeum ATCC 11539]|uniref:NAD P-binding protein n=1 Tax=Gloeophyllum trabeum (strain ATCC 11539 / FP-39264 / Madison 617) TaxID=670483 RepID=S7Q6I7_GLOTA|nr:NAD P-binding protein [Gloeophyllum trabeum ATCC 11539]EPQ55127.1 NAD P-binding protein [Gloeophyllum trabeum ATCC 11539]
MSQGSYTQDSAGYQQYALTVADFSAKVPSQLSLDEAASLPSATIAAAFGLYGEVNEAGPGSAGLTPPWEAGGRGKYSGKPIFISGGSSSVGQLVIQFATLSGFSPIIVTASPHNESLLKSLGATHVIDRSLQAEALRSAVSAVMIAQLEIIFDAVSVNDSQQTAYDLLAPGGTLVLTLPPTIRADRESHKRAFYIMGFIHGDIKPNPVKVIPGGLNGIVARWKKAESVVRS